MTDSDTQAATLDYQPQQMPEIPPKAWHVRLVGIGAVILMAAFTVFATDAAIGYAAQWVAVAFAGLNFANASAYTLVVRIIGIILIVMVLWIGFLGRQVYEKRPGRIASKLLQAGIAWFVVITISTGAGLITFFGLFLWTPRQISHWSTRKLSYYHFSVVGIIGTWIGLEMFLTQDVVGANILPRILSPPLGVLLSRVELEIISLSAMFLVIPLFVLLPRVLKSIYSLRRGIESFWADFVRDRMGLFGFAVILAIVLLAVFAPFIAPYHWSYVSTNPADFYGPPTPEHIFGTNQDGSDIYSRVIWGTQISLIVGFSASIVAVLIGTIIGLVSGYYGGFLDSILMRITDIFLCLPYLPLMLIFLVLFGQGLQNVILVIAILGWTGTARMVRSEALSLRERPLTEAAHAIGASDSYILFRHILPNTLPLILANVIIGVVAAILSEAGIAFLGFVDIHGQPSWGIVLHWASKGGALVNHSWWWIIPPGVMIMLTTLGFAFVSHAADKVVNPRLRGRGG
ncbi:MAG: ABC transporter permease [Promethearchaeota archaeon]